MGKILILKDNYNSFEKYYLNKLGSVGTNVVAQHYYKSDSPLRKVFTHYGVPLERIWYGDWMKKISDYDLIIVFDSLHTSKMLKYICSNTDKRVIFWHWNPVLSEKDKKIVDETNGICEHWTFNQADVKRYGMKYNNQFFFFQDEHEFSDSNSVFFVGKEKGRYKMLIDVAEELKKIGYEADFHIVVNNIDDYQRKEYLRQDYLDYEDVLKNILNSKAVLEIVQEGQLGITARALEATFLGKKLLTSNINIVNYDFYCRDNIFLLGYDDMSCLRDFMNRPFVPLKREIIYPYSAQGWINNFYV